MNKTLAILAAGIGSRYGGFKQMDPIGPGGEFIIDYSVYDALRAGFNKVIFIIRHDIEDPFRTTIGKRVENRVETLYAYQELDHLPRGITFHPDRRKPWGTVQAALSCAPLVDGPFAVINADDFYGSESYQRLSESLDGLSPKGTEYCMVGFQLSRTLSKHGGVTRGLCRSGGDQRLKGIVELSGIVAEEGRISYPDPEGDKKTLKPEDLVSMNMWGFTPTVFKLFEQEFRLFLQTQAGELKSEFVLPTAVNLLIEKKMASVKVLSTGSDWFGVTYPQDKEEVVGRIRALVQAGEYPDHLWKPGRLTK